MEHRFEARAAEVVGVNAAILLHNMAYWCNHNRQNGRHLHDGAYWTYNSNRAFREQFPYLGKDAIETAIKKLVDGGYVIVGFYCEDKRDRTRWFSVTELGYALDRNDECGEVHDAKVERAERPKAEGKSLKYEAECHEVIEYLRERSGRKVQHVDSNYAYIRALLNGKEPVTVDDMKAVVDVKCSQWKNDARMGKFIRPKTLFSKEHFFDYLLEASEDERHDDEWQW